MLVTRSLSHKHAFRFAVTRLGCSVASFSASSLHLQGEDITHPGSNGGESPSARPSITRTKRKVKDLPQVHVQADGTSAAPLSPWDGGLRNSKSSRSQASPNSRNSTVSGSNSRRRKKPTTSEESKDSDVLPQTPLANDILGNLDRFPHCILLTRVGQFYESYFDQAIEVAKLLSIKLTTRSWGGSRIPMCGFPLMHLDKYLKVLVQQQQRFVAICEEFMRDPVLGPKGGFDRRVTRIVTPGTLIDEPFLNPYENNYLLAVSLDGHSSRDFVGLAWIDVSTGDLLTQHIPFCELRDHLVRINPREIVLDEAYRETQEQSLFKALSEENFLISYCSPSSSVPNRPTLPLAAHIDDDDVTFHTSQLESKAQTLTETEAQAMHILTCYLKNNLLEHMPLLTSPRREAAQARMQIDAHTIKALEIRETMAEGGTSGSLFSVIKRTVTSSGTRLLTRWLCKYTTHIAIRLGTDSIFPGSPSTSIAEINARQSLVAFFKSRPHLRADLVGALEGTEDVTRIVQKFLLNRGDLGDLAALGRTLALWSSIRNRVQLEKEMEHHEHDSRAASDWGSIDALLSRLASLQTLADRISTSLVRRDDGLEENAGSSGEQSSQESQNATVDQWLITPMFSKKLENLYQTKAGLIRRRDEYERELQQSYHAPSLSLRTSPQQGFYVHILRAKRDARALKANPDRFTLLTESASTSSFLHQEWSVLGSSIVDTSTAIQVAEREAFDILRGEVNMRALDLRKNSRILDELDVTLAFANLAEEYNFVRPIIRDDTYYRVENGRHPTVELGLLNSGRVFTPNTVTFDTDSPLHIITGPNMAGKSTLLRQTALIAILAQTGSFVPAESAELGIVDRVFSRIGAKDDLFRDRSTFMVEMLETSDILRRATPRSVVIMDEVGRGTTVTDGVAIAFATIHHLLTVNRSRAMFATHFHELADMLGYSADHRGQGAYDRVRFYCTDIDETEDGYFAYAHRLSPGVNRNSHGLRVAQLAGLPPSALQVASTAASWLRERSISDHDKDQLRVLGQSFL
ncbi:DNA mismatch repair ATPase msh1 [Steccherinum ochraceum]|uniref:DNA mismatch repair ATPase msh1 n=1 Tax=Steccherinum ochraceum TaxID=92696 RepID=A0A4R0RGI6_9APHY|nr:DNA mismatch repair ATPase msh1 [Steccherinum ochraceum]